MTDRLRSSADRAVIAWLVEDGPAQASDHLVESTLATIPHLRRASRPDHVLRAALVAAAAVIVTIVVIAGIASLRTRDVGPPPPSAPVPSSEAAPSSIDPSQAHCPPLEPACGEPLGAGRVYSAAIDPAITFAVPDDFWVAGADDPGQLVLWTYTDPRRRVGVYRNPIPVEANGAAASVGASRADLLAWLRGHPELAVGEPAPAMLAGLSGESVDVALGQGATTRSDSCPTWDAFACFPILAGEGAGSRYEIGMTVYSDFRLYLLDLPDGGVLLVTLEAHHQLDLDAFAERAAPILESLRLAD